MKILIDEDLDVRLRHLFPHHEAYTVEYMGWKSLSNGAMLDKADGAGFALLITGDTTMAQEHAPKVNTDIGNCQEASHGRCPQSGPSKGS
ncbi:MAG: hypothetical protein OXF41_01175 [bacterium]|nr:hypothetical protein [bacterium]